MAAVIGGSTGTHRCLPLMHPRPSFPPAFARPERPKEWWDAREQRRG